MPVENPYTKDSIFIRINDKYHDCEPVVGIFLEHMSFIS